MDKTWRKNGGLCLPNKRSLFNPFYFTIDNSILKNVRFEAGCDGNLQAISQLLEGMPVTEVIKRLRGIDCEEKGSSCSDQLARALEEVTK